MHGHGGLDEISPAGPTRVARLEGGVVTEGQIEPGDFGLAEAPLEGLAGGDAAENARLVRAVLAGEAGARRSAVLINAAAALAIAGVERDLRAARERAEAAIDSGAAGRLLQAWAGWGR